MRVPVASSRAATGILVAHSALAVRFFLLGPATASNFTASDYRIANFTDCLLPDYYDPLLLAITVTHRNILTWDVVFKALYDLDQLLNASAEQPNMMTQTRELVWPPGRGAILKSDANTDLHNNRMEAYRVKKQRGDMLYGECGTVEYAEECQIPAYQGLDLSSAPDTSNDGKVWAPTQAIRGDMARILFYMDLRYPNFTLTDCPPFDEEKMGILSQLLQWHVDDPVSMEELERNQYVCQYYQGNRNPFVDFPDLVAAFFGVPQEIAPGTLTYPTCLEIPTPAPTREPNECSMMAPGDILFLVVDFSPLNSGVAFLALDDIPAGLDLYLTDNPWNGTAFLPMEGTVKLTVPDEGIRRGDTFTYGFDYREISQLWVREDGSFNLTSPNNTGDSVFLYCFELDDIVKPLAGFSNAGAWAPPGKDVYDEQETALPDDLAEMGAIVLPFNSHYRYTDPVLGWNVQQAMIDPNNWVGTNGIADTPAEVHNGGALSPTVSDGGHNIFANQETVSPTATDGGHNIVASTMEPSKETVVLNSPMQPFGVSVLPISTIMVPSVAPVIAVDTNPVPSSASWRSVTKILGLTTMLAVTNIFLAD